MPYTRATLDEQIHRLFDTPDLFRAWLDRHEKDDKVGVTGDAKSCPLATFARDKGLPLLIEGSIISYQPTRKEDPDAWWDDGEYRYRWDHDAPLWVDRFVDGIDELGGDDGNNIPVTMRQAKEALTATVES